MGKFKVGDKVKRTGHGFGDLKVGDVRVVASESGGGLRFEGSSFTFDEDNFEHVPAWRPKVGDRVRMVNDGLSTTGAIGKNATIEDIRYLGDHPYLLNIDGPVNYKTLAVTPRYTLASLRDIELIPATTRPTAIVALIEDGQPKPNIRPFVHATTALAEQEAKRLASKFKGSEFGVYVLTTTSQEAAPSYAHEWQRLASKGEKIAAIKELRAITGLGLKTTKDAVEDWLLREAA